jgi:hypothetical protein
MKKNIFNFKYLGLSLLLITAVFIFSGCKKSLDEKVYSQVSVDQFYKTEDQAQLALNGVYSTLLGSDIYRDGIWVTLGDVTAFTMKGGGSANGSGDRSGISNEWNTYTWTPDAIELIDDWGSYYQAINRDNTLIDALEKSGISAAVKARIDGQAKFLRADMYFDLVRMFGGIPLYIHGTSDLSEAYKSNTTADSVYAQIITDLQEAQRELSPFSPGDQAIGKATSASATALLAKVYLQQRNWQKAVEEAKKVIDMNYFALLSDYENIFNPDFQNGKENIFSIQTGGNANSKSQFYQTRAIYLFGPPAQTASVGNIQFHTLKDLVIFQVQKDFFRATPDTYRKWWTMRDKMPYYYRNGVSAANLVRDTVSMYAPFLVKYHRIDFSTGSLREGVNFPVIRYADVLLMYAEALNESNSGPTQEAYNAINMVRRRARAEGTPFAQPASIYPDLDNLSQVQFRDALLTEYAREFVGEGHYRWDLLRHDRLISNAKAFGTTAAQDKHNIFPIPAIQIGINKNLKQNPGY